MCDYSLHAQNSREARKADKLVTTKFPNTSTSGIADPAEPLVAVCMIRGTEVSFAKEVLVKPKHVFARALNFAREKLNFPEKPLGLMATFRQVRMDDQSTHHDALEFVDGRTVLINDLESGQQLTVLTLPVTGEVYPDTGDEVSATHEREHTH